MLATCSDEAEKSWGSTPTGISVWAVPPAHSMMSPTTSPNIVVVPIDTLSLDVLCPALVLSLSELVVPQAATTKPAAKSRTRVVLGRRMYRIRPRSLWESFP